MALAGRGAPAEGGRSGWGRGAPAKGDSWSSWVVGLVSCACRRCLVSGIIDGLRLYKVIETSFMLVACTVEMIAGFACTR